MKKLLAILLSIIMLLGLTCCGANNNNVTTEGTTEVEPLQTESSTEATKETTDKKVEVDGDGKIVRFGGARVTVWLAGDPGNQEGVSRVLEALNGYFLEKWGIDAEFKFQTEAGYREKISLMLTNAEACDIYCSGLVGFSRAVDYGLCYDLYDENLIQTYGTDILRRVGYEYLNGCESWGGLYGVPAFGKEAVGQWCIAVPAEYLKAVEYDMTSLSLTDANAISLADLTDLFARLKDAFPEKYMLHPGDYQTLAERLLYDPLGGDDFGVLADPLGSTEVSDLFTSQVFSDYCEVMRTWFTRGFISPEAKSGEDTAAQLAAGRILAYTVAGRPGVGQELSAAGTGSTASEIVVFMLGENFVNSSQVVAQVWSIDSFCENPEAAMVVLNALYSDSTVQNLILWGEEDVDFKVTEDGHVTFAKGKNAKDYEYYQVVSIDLMPCKYETYLWTGRDIDLWDRTEEFNKNAKKSLGIGFLFEKYDEGILTEYQALTNVVTGNIDDLIFGRVEPSEGIEKLSKELSEAGLGAYLLEKQAQFNDWAARTGKQ